MTEAGFAVAWTAASRGTLTRLPEKIATATIEFICGSLAASPHRVGKPLKLGLEGLRSARRGDYRVIYRINGNLHNVTVLAIEHRSDAYRPRSRWPTSGGRAHCCARPAMASLNERLGIGTEMGIRGNRQPRLLSGDCRDVAYQTRGTADPVLANVRGTQRPTA